ncbi:MAG: YaaL family protein [Bacillaceae bacterium]|nr:YaaL family protein [Bacillaceae bacterium]
MFGKKKLKKKQLDQQLLEKVRQLKDDSQHLQEMLRHSVDPSEKGKYDLAVKKAKYYYLLKEARYRHIKSSS